MPNRIHGIITIHEDTSRGTIYHAPTDVSDMNILFRPDNHFRIEKFGKPVGGSIPTIIHTFKAAVSHRAKQELGMVNIWQRNYYEHIVRDQEDLENTHNYIQSNSVAWLDNPVFVSQN
jgi:putative transposase